MKTATSNVIPFPVRSTKQREEIRYLLDWRETIYSNYPAMSGLSKVMADVILDRIADDLRSLSAANNQTVPQANGEAWA